MLIYIITNITNSPVSARAVTVILDNIIDLFTYLFLLTYLVS